MIVGIDLGTTNSLIGVWQDGAARLVPNSLGSVLTPSAVSIDADGSVLVGIAARERIVSHPDRSVGTFKRFMGTDRIFKLASRTFRAEELSALVLRGLKQDAERHLGQTVTEAVITVPAYFNDAQRKATRAAGEIAGLRVERLLNEPTAAALAYGLHDAGADQRIMVLDLGGGTFDVSILEMFDGVMEVRACAGDNFLGGEDFVEAIIEGFVADMSRQARFPTRREDIPQLELLWRAAENAKRALSERSSATIEFAYNGKTLDWEITPDRFESLSEKLLSRIRQPIERALRDAKLAPGQIDHLVLAGGATRMPLIKRLATRLFQRFPVAQINPDEVVASGAAVQAGLRMRDAALDDVVMTDVAPYTMGIAVSQTRNDEIVATGIYLPVIERNTTVPVSRSTSVQTIRMGQKSLTLPVYQGEARLVADNIKLGELQVPMPPGQAGEHPVDVRFTYDASGLLEVETTVRTTGTVVRLVIEGHASHLSAQEIAAKLEGLRHLKVHPRDRDEIRALLARADRLYAERLGDERSYIGAMIARFQEIIDRQNTAEIAEGQEQFAKWLNDADRSFFH